MKNIFILVSLFLSISVFSQERITKTLGEFNRIKVFSGLHVKLIKSDAYRVEVKGPQSEAVLIKNINGLLKLSVKLPDVFEAEGTLVKLYYSTDLDIIDANEGAIITSKEIIIQDFLEVKVQEGAEIDLKVQVTNLKIKAVTGGAISLFGSVDILNGIINTGGQLEAFTLQAKQANIIASSGGEAEVLVSDILEATAKLKGIIVYKIKPKKLIKKEILGGEVHFIKNYTNSNGTPVYNGY